MKEDKGFWKEYFVVAAGGIGFAGALFIHLLSLGASPDEIVAVIVVAGVVALLLAVFGGRGMLVAVVGALVFFRWLNRRSRGD